ncbi:hypothetical protein [Flavobacterium sp.]|uniref:hypothetical protein n=1 Tax=Flavobacterium sp. TaxID=239 RepID=UPI002618D499|nr:hypothetical protein [Flavobacterium sp.]
MKKIYIVMLFFQFYGFSQLLTLNDILFLKDNDLYNAKNLLVKKGWYVKSELMPDKTSAGTFAFAVESERSDRDYATYESFVEYRFNINSSSAKEIEYSTTSEKAYYLILGQLKSLNFKKRSTEGSKITYIKSDMVIEIDTKEKHNLVEKYYFIKASKI